MLAYQHYQSQIQLTGMALLHVILMYCHMFAIDKSVWCISRFHYINLKLYSRSSQWWEYIVLNTFDDRLEELQNES